MDISLSNNMENILKAKVDEGVFNSMEEAVTFAIQYAFVNNNISFEKIETLNKEIEKGWQDMETENYRDSQDVFQDLRKRYA